MLFFVLCRISMPYDLTIFLIVRRIPLRNMPSEFDVNSSWIFSVPLAHLYIFCMFMCPLQIILACLIHCVCNAQFHWLWRRKFAALIKISAFMPWKQRRRHVLSNVTKTFWKRVSLEWIIKVITRFVFEWFASINCIIFKISTLKIDLPFLNCWNKR